MFPRHPGRVLPLLLVLSALRPSAGAAQDTDWLRPLPKGVYLEEHQVHLSPEAERMFGFVILGLWPNDKTYFLLPDAKWPAGASESERHQVEEELYRLNFELSHGDILEHLPPYTHLYVALPNRSPKAGPGGKEMRYFVRYLKERHKFTDAELRRRVHYFSATTTLQWPQDSCKIIGRDLKNRVIIGVSGSDRMEYVTSIRNLASSYPDHFVIREFPAHVSAEGGDEDIVWTPDDQVAFLVGRHRVLEYLKQYQGPSFDPRSLEYGLLQTANRDFSRSAYGVRTIFMPERVLIDPSRGSEEIFHLDMEVCILPNPGPGQPRAFVPTYLPSKRHYDALLQCELPRSEVLKIQNEYDAVADQCAQIGYEVVRLPFSDHPARGPVNITRFRDRLTGKYTVLLGKYPYALPMGDPQTPQQQLQGALDHLISECGRWQKDPARTNFRSVDQAFRQVWGTMDHIAELPNPIFEEQARIYRKYGYQVVAIHTYAWGSGGLHCQLLY